MQRVSILVYKDTIVIRMAGVHEHHDVVIIGAGVHGLCVAHTFLAINSHLNLLLVDEKSTIGGVWAKKQLYPGLRANNLQGYYEYSDFPMLDAGLEDPGVHYRPILSGEAVYSYLCKYAERFGLIRRIRQNTRVVCATHNATDAAKSWALEVQTLSFSGDVGSGRKNYSITCSKLIIATGTASQPLLRSFPGMAQFRKSIIHSSDLGRLGQSLVSDSTVSRVAVLGGSKLAHDAVYMFATSGKRVTWLTRSSGRGAMPMAKPNTQMGPWSFWLESLLTTRILSWFGLCPWSDGDGFGWVRWALHNTSPGRRLVKGYFANMSAESAQQSGILDHQKTKVLVPKQTLLWYGTQASSLNYDNDFYDVIDKNDVEIVQHDIEDLSGDCIIYQNGNRTPIDMIICATGFDYRLDFQLEPAE